MNLKTVRQSLSKYVCVENTGFELKEGIRGALHNSSTNNGIPKRWSWTMPAHSSINKSRLKTRPVGKVSRHVICISRAQRVAYKTFAVPLITYAFKLSAYRTVHFYDIVSVNDRLCFIASGLVKCERRHLSGSTHPCKRINYHRPANKSRGFCLDPNSS